jgi:hypothetical protein
MTDRDAGVILPLRAQTGSGGEQVGVIVNLVTATLMALALHRVILAAGAVVLGLMTPLLPERRQKSALAALRLITQLAASTGEPRPRATSLLGRGRLQDGQGPPATLGGHLRDLPARRSRRNAGR